MQKVYFAAWVVLLLTVYSSLLSAQSDLNIEGNRTAQEQKYKSDLDSWMLKAYGGDKDAQFKVGALYTNTDFGEADYEQAVYWYKQAARQGHALAQYNLGHQYLTGVGVIKSEATAMKWWLEAAKRDHTLAQFNVGRAYYLGIGLEKDHKKSKYWFSRAAENNDPKSIEIMTKLGWLDGNSTVAAAPFSGAETTSITADNSLPEVAITADSTPRVESTPTTEQSDLAIKKARDRQAADSLESKIIPINISEPTNSSKSDKQATIAGTKTDKPPAISNTSSLPASRASSTATHTSDPIAAAPVDSSPSGRNQPDDNMQTEQESKPSRVMVTKRNSAKEPIDQSAKLEGGILVAPVTTQQAPSNKSAEDANPIAVYTNPKVRSVLIAIIDDRSELSSSSEGSEWTEVKSNAGFPVWMHADFIDVTSNTNEKRGRVSGSNVNARSVPIISSGTIVGRLNKGELVTVLERRGTWYRVIGPTRFTAWVKTADFRTQISTVKPKSERTQSDVATETKSIPNKKVQPSSDDEWLFKQKAKYFTLQLGSFTDQGQAQKFIQRINVSGDPLFHHLMFSLNGIQQTTFLYGSFRSRKAAEKNRSKINQPQAWIRTIGGLQDKQCGSWKGNSTHSDDFKRHCKND
jgi:TPR repeat protein